MSVDLKKSLRRFAQYYQVSVGLPGTASAADYLGDTTNDAGSPMPDGTIEEAYVNFQTAPNTTTTITLENEATGTTHDIDVTSAYHEETDIGLNFSDGDELSVAVTSADGGSDGHVSIHHEVDLTPMN